MKVLITGIAGLLGSRLADWIIENHPEVQIVGIDDLSGGYRSNVNSKVNFWQMNLVNHPIENCFEDHKFDYVFHFAAYAAEGLSPFIRKYNYENNLISTTRIVNNCIKYGVKRLVFSSSMAVYGYGTGNVFDENQIPSPIDPYGIAKYACEMDIKVAGEQHGLDWCIIRPHNVYGIKQNIWDKYRNVLGIWMYQYLEGEPMTIFGDGQQTRAFSFIDDSLKPLWNAATKPEASKQIINLGGIKEYSILEANELLRKIIGGGKVNFVEQRHEVKYAIPTYQKSIDILEFEHKTDLEEGLTKMWDWAQKQSKRKRFVWKQYELDKGLYKFWQ
jgi:UDP-glucose 4-epimerase